jgi:hypothetical protein
MKAKRMPKAFDSKIFLTKVSSGTSIAASSSRVDAADALLMSKRARSRSPSSQNKVRKQLSPS